MNIEINLLPEELRPRPPVETKTFIMAIGILALVAGSAFLFMEKSSADSDRVAMEDRIDVIEREKTAILNTYNQLNKTIGNLKTLSEDYSYFVDRRVDWGVAVEDVDALIPKGIQVVGMTQAGNALIVEGTTSGGYSAVASYGRALNTDKGFTLMGLPSLTATAFSLIIQVEPGGAE